MIVSVLCNCNLCVHLSEASEACLTPVNQIWFSLKSLTSALHVFFKDIPGFSFTVSMVCN